MVRLALLYALVSVAHADTSVAGDRRSTTERCSYEQGPFWRARHLLTDERRSRLGSSDYLRDVSASHLLFTRNLATPAPAAETRVLDLVTESVHELQAAALGLVEDRTGVLLGTVWFERGWLAFTGTDGRLRWHVPAPARMRDQSFHTLTDGNRLIVANFDRYATGAALYAFDLRTGALAWTAEVEQMNVGHSEYYNDVALERSGDAIVMRGYEAAGCYVQTFDPASGRRLSSVMDRKW